MRRRSIFGLAVFMAALATPAAAVEPTRTIVRIQPGLVGRTVIQTVCALLHCQVDGSLDTLPEETTAPSSLFLVKNLPPPSWLVNYTLLGIASVEPDLAAQVNDDFWYSSQATTAVLDQLWNRAPASYFGTTA